MKHHCSGDYFRVPVLCGLGAGSGVVVVVVVDIVVVVVGAADSGGAPRCSICAASTASASGAGAAADWTAGSAASSPCRRPLEGEGEESGELLYSVAAAAVAQGEAEVHRE